MIRRWLTYAVLKALNLLSRTFYTHEVKWVGDVPAKPWVDYRLVAILNHTSLFEALFAGSVPDRFLRRMASHGIVPVAAKTADRPFIGFFFKLIAGNVVPISRERDHTWTRVLESIDQDSMVIILPEGRMKRANGLDAFGRPLVVRGGIADLLQVIPSGPMLIAYSQGLHHIQIPGQRTFRIFKKVGLHLEQLDIAAYRAAMEAKGGGTLEGFKRAVIDDLMARRDRYCPTS